MNDIPRVAAAILAIYMAGALGCTGREFARTHPKSISKEDRRKIYVKGTRAYDAVLKQLTLSEDEARSRVIAHVRVEHGIDDANALIPTRGHNLIVGRAFVFASPSKMGYETTGYYVDGITGKVIFREGVGLVRP